MNRNLGLIERIGVEIVLSFLSIRSAIVMSSLSCRTVFVTPLERIGMTSHILHIISYFIHLSVNIELSLKRGMDGDRSDGKLVPMFDDVTLSI